MKDKINKNMAIPHSLSANSIKTKNEFGEANVTFSLIYNRFKQVMALYWDKKKLNRFRKLILDIIRSGPVAKTGSRKLLDGDFKMLEGFQLNTKNSVNHLFQARTTIDIDPVKGYSLTIEPFKYHSAFVRPHPKTSVAEVSLYVLSFDMLKYTSRNRSIVLLRQVHEEDMKEPVRYNFPLEENQLTLVILKVSFKGKPDDWEILDRQYIGATLTNAVYIKDGNLVKFVSEPKETPLEKPSPEVGQWVELD